MFEKIKLMIITVFVVVILIFLVPFQSISGYFESVFQPKATLKVKLYLSDRGVTSISAESSNKLILRARVLDANSEPAPNIPLNFSVKDKLGSIKSQNKRTNADGECIAVYTPPDLSSNQGDSMKSPTITAYIPNTSVASSVTVNLKRPPIVFVHGYLASETDFQNLKTFLTSKGFETSCINFDSKKGVIAAAKELEAFLNTQRDFYHSKGFQVQKFNVIAHSLGGLVARYYSSSGEYLSNSNIRKIIFLSVPQKGTPWASMGINYFNDQGIRDLAPDNYIFTTLLPKMINKGFNPTIQIGNIIVQNDEVVSQESANIEEWGIKSEVFDVGESNFTMENLINGKLLESSNHKKVLNNTRVFDRVLEMLKSELPQPVIKK